MGNRGGLRFLPFRNTKATLSVINLACARWLISILLTLVGLCRATSLGGHVVEMTVQCETLRIDICEKLNFYNSIGIPNFLGHKNQEDVETALNFYKDAIAMECSPDFSAFICALHASPCTLTKVGNKDTDSWSIQVLAPCREWCYHIQETCTGAMEDLGFRWSDVFECGLLPTHADTQEGTCLNMIDLENMRRHYMEQRIETKPSSSPIVDTPPGTITEYDFASEDVSSPTPSFLRRRYDVVDLGDPLFFQGWADIQGTGAANDYCRVIGKGKRKFLSCALAGSEGQDHGYVSKLGFDLGHRSTWFMRDLDGDGRDDYCRCVGHPPKSRISCMKSGANGFHGGPLQGGDQYTFDVPATDICHDKPLNPLHGA